MRDYTLHLVTDDRLDNLCELASLAIEGGATIIQLRNKTANKHILFEAGKKLLKIARAKKIPLIINDYIDLALALNADGAHIGQTDLPCHAARKLLGKNKILGLSLQTVAQAKNALACDADYFGVGPIFQTNTKKNVSEMGLSLFHEIVNLLKKPCVGIGGITLNNAKEVMRQGAAGIAVVSGICNSNDPKSTTEKYRQCLNTIIAS